MRFSIKKALLFIMCAVVISRVVQYVISYGLLVDVGLFGKSVVALGKLDLAGKWTLRNATMGGIQANVPGGVHTALMGEGIIGDPYYRKNDAKYLWIGRTDWNYDTTFTVSEEIGNKKNIILICDGLDTVASVYVNNILVGQSDNMFVRYMFDIKHAVNVGANTISVNITSAVNYAKARAAALDYTIPPECPPSYFRGECHANKIRKTQCSFSWDWGPAFVTQGIWKDIYIQSYDDLVITDVTTETIKDKGDTWRLKVDIFTKCSPDDVIRGYVDVQLDNVFELNTTHVVVTGDADKITVEQDIPKTAGIEAWWPRGYGKQKLYTVHVYFSNQDKITIAHKFVRIGFRTVELVQDKVSHNENDGRTFYFRINNQPIFLKGSNWIPADSFLERVSKSRLENYLQSTVDANMNTLRVWGGGIYESDEFYNLADELGILIYQDFMFACALYPVDDVFIRSVKQEVTHQIRRLKNHPCVFTYSGNNENDGAINGGWWYTTERHRKDYVKLYKDTIYTIVAEEDPTRPYLPSSPSNGIKTVQDGWLTKGSPGGTKYGDIHDYQYFRPFFEVSTYKVPRMASEYGLESFPSIESLEHVYEEGDMSYNSVLNNNRQHHGSGNSQIMNLIRQYMDPPNSTNSRQQFDDITYCSQIVQSIAMRVETEHYRRWQSSLNYRKEGNTMGALYWMLADIWQAPSWASLEYGGKWKMLHYYAKLFFSPVLISPVVIGNDLDIFMVIDEVPTFEHRNPLDNNLHIRPRLEENIRPFSMFSLRSWKKQSIDLLKQELDNKNVLSNLAGNLYMKVYSWDSMEAKYTWEIPFQILNSAESVHKVSVDSVVDTAGCESAAHCMVYFHLGDPDNGPTSWLPLTTFKNSKGLKKANIKIKDVKIKDTSSNEFIIDISTDAISPFVWLEAHGIKGRFSDNGFMQVDAKKQLVFYAWQDVSVEDLHKSLKIKSLLHIYE